MHYQKIVGEKVYLSPIDIENDVPVFTKWMNEDRQMAWQNGFYRQVRGEEKVRELVQSWMECGYNFSVVRKSDRVLVGNIAIFNISSPVQGGSVGIFIGDEANRGLGYGKEALELLMEFAFLTLHFHFLRVEVFSFNKKAIDLYKKIGFKEVGLLREGIYHNGEYKDIVLMDILEREYRSK